MIKTNKVSFLKMLILFYYRQTLCNKFVSLFLRKSHIFSDFLSLKKSIKFVFFLQKIFKFLKFLYLYSKKVFVLCPLEIKANLFIFEIFFFNSSSLLSVLPKGTILPLIIFDNLSFHSDQNKKKYPL